MRYIVTIEPLHVLRAISVEEVSERKPITLKRLQEGVNGTIEHLNPNLLVPDLFNDFNIDWWCNDEGKLERFYPNIPIYYNHELVDIIVGNVLVTWSDNEGETWGLNKTQLVHVLNRLKWLFEEYTHFQTIFDITSITDKQLQSDIEENLQCGTVL